MCARVCLRVEGPRGRAHSPLAWGRLRWVRAAPHHPRGAGAASPLPPRGQVRAQVGAWELAAGRRLVTPEPESPFQVSGHWGGVAFPLAAKPRWPRSGLGRARPGAQARIGSSRGGAGAAPGGRRGPPPREPGRVRPAGAARCGEGGWRDFDAWGVIHDLFASRERLEAAAVGVSRTGYR